MNAAPTPCPGAGPPVTWDYFQRLPDRAFLGLTKAEEKVYLHVLRNEGRDGSFAGKNGEIGEAVGIHRATAGEIAARLAREHPPGVDHPYFAIEGGTRNRRIRVLYRPKDAPNQRPPIRSQKASNLDDIRSQKASNPRRETRENQGLAASPLFKRNSKGEDNVDVISIPEEPLTRAPARDPGPVASPLHDPGPVASPLHDPGPVASPLQAPANGIDHELAVLTADQLRERIAGMTGRIDCLAARARRPVAESLELWGLQAQVGEARAMLRATERPQGPTPTPKVESLAPPAGGAPAAKPGAPAPHVETPDLIRRLKSPAGATMVALVVARLCEKLDPEFEPLYRRCCADVLAGRLDVGAMIGGFRWARNAPGFGKKKGPSFAAYIGRQRETRQQRRAPPVHRRE